MMNANEPTPTDAARAWHADELAPRPRKEPPMPPAEPSADRYALVCDVVERTWQHWPLDARPGEPLHSSNDARAAARRIFEILGLDPDGEPNSVKVIRSSPPTPGVSLTDVYGDSPGVRAASDRMAGTRIPLDSEDDGEPD